MKITASDKLRYRDANAKKGKDVTINNHNKPPCTDRTMGPFRNGVDEFNTKEMHSGKTT